MITFEDHGSEVVLVYSADRFGSVAWVDERLKSEGEVTLSRVFTVRRADLLSGEDDDQNDDDVRRFVVGTIKGEYRRIRKGVLGLKYDLRIATSIRLTRSTFVAERNISIFGRIDDLVTEQIVVGGSRESAIPEEEFEGLLQTFPNSTEVTYYAQTRVARILREYLETTTDAERRLANYVERRERSATDKWAEPGGRIPAANELELEKFTYVRDRLVEMLKDAESFPESDWQKSVADLFLLIFPQYVVVLHNVQVEDRYSKERMSTPRYIDLMLVGANGCVDIIEIKKPFERGLMSKRQYRDNHVPVRELSGSIMQAEKYLFYLSKSGRSGEESIGQKYANDLPDGLRIRIANPKAIILSGRDSNLSDRERFDFEFVRRNYSNVVDIITYDDLLRRLGRIIETLGRRVGLDDDRVLITESGRGNE
jgi:hypothetical protein